MDFEANFTRVSSDDRCNLQKSNSASSTTNNNLMEIVSLKTSIILHYPTCRDKKYYRKAYISNPPNTIGFKNKNHESIALLCTPLIAIIR
jgi:hypothetical protein